MSSATEKKAGLGGLLVVLGALAGFAMLFNKKHTVPSYKLPDLEYDEEKVKESWRHVLNNDR